MTTPQSEPAPEEVSMPTVRTGPAEGSEAPPPARRWQWGHVPAHLGRARTSTVVLSVLFLAIGTLYLNVRPEENSAGTVTTGQTSDVETPVQPTAPTETGEPEPTTEPAPTSGRHEGTEAPTTTPPGTTTGPSAPTTESAEPTGTSEPTSGTTPSTIPLPTSTTSP